MQVIVKEVCTEDWTAIYLNNKKVLEDHNVDIKDVCRELQNAISNNGNPYLQPNFITSIEGEHYYLNDEYAEEYGFPERFSDIPEEAYI